MRAKLLISISIFLILTLGAFGSGQVRIHSDEIKQKVDGLLVKMTIEEKVGQMTQVTLNVVSNDTFGGIFPHKINKEKLRKAVVDFKVGSIFNVSHSAFSIGQWHEVIEAIQDMALKETRLKIPVLYGIDSIHGANYVKNAVIFPQSIGMAAAFNRELVRQEAVITAYETRAAGIPWNFNPVLGMGRQPLWSRLFETHGEDPYMAGEYARVYVKAQEGEDNAVKIGPHFVATSVKHYLGYSFPLSGKDRTPAWIPEGMLREYFLPPFAEGILAGSHTVMINSTEINGVPVHASPFYLKTILRDQLGFQGLACSDWADIKMLHERSRVASTQKEAVKIAVMAGVDMSMVPSDFSFYNHLVELVKEGEVPVSRIDEAVLRILMVKFKLDLFKNPYPDKTMAKKVGSKEFRAVALQAAQESITLLKNQKNILPLSGQPKILVTGPNADKLAVLGGGWTYTWQGRDERFYPAEKDTIKEALEKRFSKKNTVYVPGCSHEKAIDIQKAVDAAKTVDVVVACVGENAYCEREGLIDDLTLPEVQLELVTRLAETGKPVILVLAQGRPRLIRKIVDKVGAIVMAYLPGDEGGTAIAQILAGDVNPSGRLPITYPRYPNDLKCYDYKYSEVADFSKYNPEFPFGFGLSYTTFKYKGLTLDKETMTADDTLTVTVTVENTGKVKGKEAVLLYLSDLYASVTPSVRRLKGFEKISLDPGEEKQVSFKLTKKHLSFIGRDMKRIVEPGDFKVAVGPLSATFKVE